MVYLNVYPGAKEVMAYQVAQKCPTWKQCAPYTGHFENWSTLGKNMDESLVSFFWFTVCGTET